MDIAKIDKNFKLDIDIPEKDVQWFNAAEDPFTLYGGFVDEKGYYRMPREIAAKVSEGVDFLNTYTAGIRVRFSTNSPYIAIGVKWECLRRMNHMPASGSSGFDLFRVNNGKHKFIASLIPTSFDSIGGYSSFKYLNAPIYEPHFTDGEVYDYILNFPLYNDVTELYIGIKEGSVFEKGGEYSNKAPVVFYGSSITQGGCASRPGNCYQNFLSRALDMDYVNLGFSGNGKAEDIMVTYLAGLEMSAFVSDYDHNAPTEEHLKNTHYKLYETIRKSHPNLPYIMITKPDYRNCEWKRRTIIFETFMKAREAGDKNVYFIDGAGLFNGDEWDACTVDGCHPNDLGFYKMAQGILPVLKNVL